MITKQLRLSGKFQMDLSWKECRLSGKTIGMPYSDNSILNKSIEALQYSFFVTLSLATLLPIINYWD